MMKNTSRLSAVAAILLAGCGGGGGSDTAVSANPPPTAAPSPATVGNTAPAPAAPNPPPSPSALTPPPPAPASEPPGAPPAPPVPSVSGSAVVKALASHASGRAVSGEPDGYFSTIDVRFDPASSRFTSRSHLTQLEQRFPPWQAAETNEVALSLSATTDNGGTFVFNGSGSVTAPGGQHSLSAGQYSIPANVPLDRTILVYNVPALPGSSVRLFVGSIPDKPRWMRVCWNVDVPNTLRVVCSRNDRETGAPLGVDAGNDVRGTILTHRSTDSDPIQWSVLKCQARVTEVEEVEGGVRPIRREYSTFRSYAYDLDRPYGGLVTLPYEYPITSTFLGNGDVMHEISGSSGYRRYTVRNSAFIVAAEDASFGGTGGASAECQVY